MSTQMTEPHTNGHDRELSGVRTYRGRKLEDLIPQIRAELGPDAIILRQREGLMGGVGGFFAQKCVEVDAQAAPHAPKIDIYDEDEPVSGWDEGLEDFLAPSVTPEPAAPALPAPAPTLPAPEQPAPIAAEPAAAEPVVPEPPAVETPAPTTEPLSAESFVSRLEQAAAHVDIDELVKLVTSGRVLSDAPAGPAPEERAAPATEPIVPPAPEPVVAEPVIPEAPVVETPAPTPVIPEAPAPIAETPAPSPVAPAHAAPQTAPVPPAASPWMAKQAGDLDSNEAQVVVAELTAQGISESWANELIVAAAAHRSPLAKGSLRDAVRATLAAIIPAPAPLPASGAAVAFVGAGGAGKTRCAAALASAYAKGSTHASSVVSLGSDDWGGDLKELLKGQNVWVMGAANGTEAAPAVQHGRDGGLVVVDTAAAAPRDPATVESLATELRALNLDAVYIAVPATFSVHAARKLLDGFAALGADGIAVTHADEADQLGIAAELSQISGMPVAYIHDGLELDGALSAADPSTLAARLLP
jgi:flagellar biosynthesis GTPase FlhF